MGDHKSGGKRAVNRHQTQSKASAAAQERAIERTERQAGQQAAAQWQAEEPCTCDSIACYECSGDKPEFRILQARR